MLLRMMVCVLLAATALAADSVATSRDVMREVRAAESAIDQRFSGLSGANPMGMVFYTRGGYIDGFGAVFTLEVNLAPTANISPFRQSYSEDEKRQLNIRKRQRLEDLEALVREILVEESSKLTSVPQEEKVALVVSLFHFRWEDLTKLPTQLVMQATRKVLLERRAGKLEPQEFRKQLAVQYF